MQADTYLSYILNFNYFVLMTTNIFFFKYIKYHSPIFILLMIYNQYIKFFMYMLLRKLNMRYVNNRVIEFN